MSDKPLQPLDILNCGASGRVEFALVCPVGWEALRQTEDPNLRRCDACARKVYRCFNAVDAGLRADQGECVAVPAWLARGAREARSTDRIIIGQPRPTQRLFQELIDAKDRKREVTDEGGDAGSA